MKKEQENILTNYHNNMTIGIISGLIVYIVTFMYNYTLEKTLNIALSFIAGILVLISLYWFFVTKPIKRQREI